MQILEDANIKFDFVDVEDTTSPRMSQVIALTNDKDYHSYLLRGCLCRKRANSNMLGLTSSVTKIIPTRNARIKR